MSGANVFGSGRDASITAAGDIGNLTGSDGDVTVTTTGALTNTNGQIGATHNLAVNAATLSGRRRIQRRS